MNQHEFPLFLSLSDINDLLIKERDKYFVEWENTPEDDFCTTCKSFPKRKEIYAKYIALSEFIEKHTERKAFLEKIQRDAELTKLAEVMANE